MGVIIFQDPPDMTSSSFLHDDRRQGPLPEKLRARSVRNRMNYGGSDFSNVKNTMRQERQVRSKVVHTAARFVHEYCMCVHSVEEAARRQHTGQRST